MRFWSLSCFLTISSACFHSLSQMWNRAPLRRPGALRQTHASVSRSASDRWHPLAHGACALLEMELAIPTQPGCELKAGQSRHAHRRWDHMCTYQADMDLDLQAEVVALCFNFAFHLYSKSSSKSDVSTGTPTSEDPQNPRFDFKDGWIPCLNNV